jgi:hypothetical protein
VGTWTSIVILTALKCEILAFARMTGKTTQDALSPVFLINFFYILTAVVDAKRRG